jgi:hypothetical protein
MDRDEIAVAAKGLSKRMRQMVAYLYERGAARERYMDLRTVMALDARKLTSGGHDSHSFEATVFLTAKGFAVAAYLKDDPVNV